MVVATLREQWARVAQLDGEIGEIERRITLWHRTNPASLRIAEIPGVGVLTATAVHALFIGQYPQALQFEKFIYLYTAIDACYKLAESLRGPAGKFSHADRIEWMCNEFGIQTPAWGQATGTGGGGTEVSVLRNDTLHEALYVGEPLGFALHGAATGENVTLEMAALVCRPLMALIGGQDSSYLTSPVDHAPTAGPRSELKRTDATRCEFREVHFAFMSLRRAIWNSDSSMFTWPLKN